jgi:hypothetical protein
MVVLLSAPTVLAQDFCKGDFTYDGDVDANDVTTFLEHFGRSIFSNPCPPDGPAPVAKTGQTTSYATYDDGDLQPGVELPINSRFEDPGDLIVIDNLTGLMWLYNANCMGSVYPEWDNLGVHGDGQVPWENALNFVEQINNGWYPECQGGNPKYTDWRLPTLKELQSLVHYGYSSPALPNTAGTGQWVENDPFNLVQTDTSYWSSTTEAQITSLAWFVSMYDGMVFNAVKSNTMYVWPVRGGRHDRFTVNGDGTVTDHTTGLVWLEDAFCPQINEGGLGRTWDIAMQIASGLSSGYCNLTDGSVPGDWRLPTKEEWEEFVCPQYSFPALCDTEGTGQWSEGDPFNAVQSDGYWSSAEYDSSNAWSVYLSNGSMFNVAKSGYYYVWPVRGGQ